MRELQYMKVVRPDWLVESIKAGVLLPWQDFIFKSGLRIDESQGEKVAQKSLFDNNFVSSQRSKKLGATAKTPKTSHAAPGVSSLPSSPSDIYSLVSTPSPKAPSPGQPQTLRNPPSWMVLNPEASSPEMPPPRQPPRPSTPETPIDVISTHAEVQSPHHSAVSAPSPISLLDSSPPPPAQRPRQPSGSLPHTPTPSQHPSSQGLKVPDLPPSQPQPQSTPPDIPSPVLPISPTTPTSFITARSDKPQYAAHESNPNAQRVMANPEWRRWWY